MVGDIMKRTLGENIFSFFNYVLLGSFALSAVYPFIYIISASLSSVEAVTMGKVWIFPIELNLASYQQVLSQKGIWIAYGNTIFYTVAGTAVNLFVTICGAYALSKKRLRGRAVFIFMITLTMWFRAGMIPFYLNLRDMNLLDKRITILIAFACTSIYFVLMKTYFISVPDSMEESAKIDGANDIQILTRIYIPLSTASITAIGLFYAVGRWNGFFWAMLIFKDENKVPLQVLLRKLIVVMEMNDQILAVADANPFISKETIMYAIIIVSILPIVAVYPFIQMYFIKGVMIGAIKE